jgi:hypothetical protein
VYIKTTGIAAILLLAALPASAQERGTIELGVFGNTTSFDSDLNMNDSWGGGGRVGAFLLPWLSIEGEIGHKSAARSLGLHDVGVEALAARVLAAPLRFRAASLLVGAGVVHTDWEAGESDGLQGLVGLKYDLGNFAALRVDAMMDFNRDDVRNLSSQLGISVYRHAVGGLIGD